LDFTAEYRALITRTDDGVTLFTCPVIPASRTDIIQQPNFVAANQQFTVSFTGVSGKILVMNLSGLQISKQNLTQGENQVFAPGKQGVYITAISDNSGNSENRMLIVK
jgi:hypothetical protein